MLRIAISLVLASVVQGDGVNCNSGAPQKCFQSSTALATDGPEQYDHIDLQLLSSGY